MTSKKQLEQFKKMVWDYYHANRRDFPWRKNINPYRVLVSEIMLQQTQVSRGIIKYKEFLKAFPTFPALAKASNADVLTVWQGLGYNRRALYLKKAAEVVVSEYKGKLPDTPELLVKLPGIGIYTAGAVCAFAFNKPVVFIDTNVRRIYIHHFFNDKEGITDAELIPYIEATLDKENAREWYSALMDYGSILGLKEDNANKRSAHYVKQSKFEGSLRQIRGKILKLVTNNKQVTRKELQKVLNETPERIEEAIKGLEKDGMLIVKKNTIAIA
ncbi:MAG: A/G-specific adenine glycosylase [Candidatus Wolfebacteria bacterium GW2011_GWE2_44_13]|uniref:Adenine DNA glycosylase n=1 Tax=Candidatus Wolfebacteria bacterium GW2011_GWE2_44_13 TaxID=1619017 RepID=A0A0G1JHJ3_9BACT|nr:MAG: A/G-specific adenine glycosylase [Candidatus Wolfebacteria bacterium GW2011_GWE2_44_13]